MEQFISWTSFDQSIPTVPFFPEGSGAHFPATFLFDIEITEGASKGKRMVLPAYFLHGDIKDWAVPYVCETIKSMFGDVIYHNWAPYPAPAGLDYSLPIKQTV